MGLVPFIRGLRQKEAPYVRPFHDIGLALAPQLVGAIAAVGGTEIS